jgi:hypothetical protein
MGSGQVSEGAAESSEPQDEESLATALRSLDSGTRRLVGVMEQILHEIALMRRAQEKALVELRRRSV